MGKNDLTPVSHHLLKTKQIKHSKFLATTKAIPYFVFKSCNAFI